MFQAPGLEPGRIVSGRVIESTAKRVNLEKNEQAKPQRKGGQGGNEKEKNERLIPAPGDESDASHSCIPPSLHPSFGYGGRGKRFYYAGFLASFIMYTRGVLWESKKRSA
ncbi:hypothetical protein B0H14DRAFT_3133409 [Mycena olivaceomarginata]|nr:hypothetical protein B0H14DRAFT_3133409 [Mycena olivaceomarginata]